MPTKISPKDDMVEMLDGRIFWTRDNWQTIAATHRGNRSRTRMVTDKDEADLVRFIAVSQSSAGPA